MLGLIFSSKLDWSSYIISIAKTASKKIGAFIGSLKFLSPEVVLYLHESTISQYMEYCCHVWAGAPSCYFELFGKLQKQICRTVGLSFATSLEHLAHCQNVANLSLFYRHYFGRCSLELTQLVPLPFCRGGSTHYSDRLHDFSVTIRRCYNVVNVNSFFPCTAGLWNSLPIEWFPLTYDLNGFKSFGCEFFLNRFPVRFNLFVVLFSCNFMPRSGCAALHGVNRDYIYLCIYSYLLYIYIYIYI